MAAAGEEYQWVVRRALDGANEKRCSEKCRHTAMVAKITN